MEKCYLTDIPQDVEQYGFCKVLTVRREVISVKHILIEIFVRKSIDIENYLNNIDWSLFDYMEYITNKLMRIHHFSRTYVKDINDIVKSDRDNFFPTIALYEGLQNCIVLDFDKVVTENSFKQLYELCISRCKTIICSGNPNITTDWFIKRGYSLPYKIYSCKGKFKKIKQLIEIQKKHDYVFYVDDQIEYLQYAWIFGIQTYQYKNKKIRYFTMQHK